MVTALHLSRSGCAGHDAPSLRPAGETPPHCHHCRHARVSLRHVAAAPPSPPCPRTPKRTSSPRAASLVLLERERLCVQPVFVNERDIDRVAGINVALARRQERILTIGKRGGGGRDAAPCARQQRARAARKTAATTAVRSLSSRLRRWGSSRDSTRRPNSLGRARGHARGDARRCERTRDDGPSRCRSSRRP